MRQLFWFKKQLATSQFFRKAQQWQNKGAKIQIISAETLSNFGFGRNKFETRISAEISLHHYYLVDKNGTKGCIFLRMVKSGGIKT